MSLFTECSRMMALINKESSLVDDFDEILFAVENNDEEKFKAAKISALEKLGDLVMFLEQHSEWESAEKNKTYCYDHWNDFYQSYKKINSFIAINDSKAFSHIKYIIGGDINLYEVLPDNSKRFLIKSGKRVIDT